MFFFATRVKKKGRFYIMDFYTVGHHDVVDCNPHVGFEFLSAVLLKITIFQGNDSASSSNSSQVSKSLHGFNLKGKAVREQSCLVKKKKKTTTTKKTPQNFEKFSSKNISLHPGNRLFR